MKINGVLEGGLLENRADVGDDEAKKIGRVTVGANVTSPYGSIQVAPVYVGRGDIITRLVNTSEVDLIKSGYISADAVLNSKIDVVSGSIGFYSFYLPPYVNPTGNSWSALGGGTVTLGVEAQGYQRIFSKEDTYIHSVHDIALGSLDMTGVPNGKYRIELESDFSIGYQVPTSASFDTSYGARISSVTQYLGLGFEQTFRKTSVSPSGFVAETGNVARIGATITNKNLIGQITNGSFIAFEMREYDLHAGTYAILGSSISANAFLSYKIITQGACRIVYGDGPTSRIKLTRVQ